MAELVRMMYWSLFPGDLITRETGRFVYLGITGHPLNPGGSMVILWSVGQRQIVIEPAANAGGSWIDGLLAVDTGKRIQWLRFAFGLEP